MVRNRSLGPVLLLGIATLGKLILHRLGKTIDNVHNRNSVTIHASKARNLMLFEANAVKAGGLFEPLAADHVWVKAGNGATFDCWGGHAPGKVVCSGVGNYALADCYRCPLSLPEPIGFVPDTACIGFYLEKGVCHQSANRFLYSTGVTLPFSVRGYFLSVALYGVYGGTFQFLAVYHACGGAKKDMFSLPSGDPIFEAVRQVHASVDLEMSDPNEVIVEETAALIRHHLPDFSALDLDTFKNFQREYLEQKDSVLGSGLQGRELALRFDELCFQVQERLRNFFGDENYVTLMGIDDPNERLSLIADYATGLLDEPLPYNAAFVSQGVPTLMIADGRTYAVTIEMRNTGGEVWRPGRIRLRSENPPDNTTWGINRVDLPDGANVNPRSKVIFSFNVTPRTLGKQLFRWGMVRENVGPFGQKNAPVWVTVAKDALFLRQSVPATIVAGTTQPVSVTFRNISAVPWTRGTGFRLGSQGPANNTIWGLNRVELPHDVPPGTDVQFDFSITAPAAAAKCNFQWQVLQEQVAWLGQPSPAFEVRVMPPLTKAAVFLSQTVANPIHPGAVQVVAVTMRNVGTATWTAAAQFKLGSQQPTNNVRWGTNRVPLPHDVPPNAEVTFTFGITARDAVGTWNFCWQMLQEGPADPWFGQITPNIQLNVAQQAPRQDLCFVKTRNTASGKVEAFTATNSSRYTTGRSSATRFSSAEADNGWFGMHGNGNIYFVKTKNTASGTIEVFTATASSGYTEGISTATRFLINDGANGTFGMLVNGDLYFIKTRNTGTGMIEAFTALGPYTTGAPRPAYTTGLSTPARFPAADAANGWFGMLPTSDVYFIKTRNTGSGKVEAFTATSASGYTTGIQAPTRFANTDADNGTFGMLPNGDVYFVKTKNTTSGKIEAFIATRASNYTSGLSATIPRFASGEGPNGIWRIV
jgi:hypothetical protein